MKAVRCHSAVCVSAYVFLQLFFPTQKGKASSEIVLKIVEQAAGNLGKNLDANDTISFSSSHFGKSYMLFASSSNLVGYDIFLHLNPHSGLRIDRVDPVQFINQTVVFVGLEIKNERNGQYSANHDEVVFVPANLPEAIQGERCHC